MKTERYISIEMGESELTKDEIEQGWHFCAEWDYMLVGPDMDEMDCCQCRERKR